MGMISFTTDTSSNIGTQKRALMAIKALAIRPTGKGGKKFSMNRSPGDAWDTVIIAIEPPTKNARAGRFLS
jgi:hypothetical protein